MAGPDEVDQRPGRRRGVDDADLGRGDPEDAGRIGEPQVAGGRRSRRRRRCSGPRIIAIVGFGKSRSAAWAARLSRRTSAIGSCGIGRRRAGRRCPHRRRSWGRRRSRRARGRRGRRRARRARRAAPPTSRAVMALRFSGRSMVRHGDGAVPGDERGDRSCQPRSSVAKVSHWAGSPVSYPVGTTSDAARRSRG